MTLLEKQVTRWLYDRVRKSDLQFIPPNMSARLGDVLNWRTTNINIPDRCYVLVKDLVRDPIWRAIRAQ